MEIVTHISSSPPKCDVCPVFPSTVLRFAGPGSDLICKGKTHLALPVGRSLYTESEAFRGVYCLQDGIVALSRGEKRRGPGMVRFALPGEVLALESLLSSDPYAHTASALTPVRACFISKELLSQVLASNPAFQLNVIQEICSRIEFLEQHFSNILNRELIARLADAILLLTQHNPTLDLNACAEELASFVRAPGKAVERVLRELAATRVITLENGAIINTDSSALQRLAAI